MAACSFGRLDTVRLLVPRGAKLEYTRERGGYMNSFFFIAAVTSSYRQVVPRGKIPGSKEAPGLPFTRRRGGTTVGRGPSFQVSATTRPLATPGRVHDRSPAAATSFSGEDERKGSEKLSPGSVVTPSGLPASLVVRLELMLDNWGR